MTKLDVVRRIQIRLQDFSPAMEAIVDQFVDDVLADMSARQLFPSLKTESTTNLVEGQTSYSFEDDFDKLDSVYVPENGEKAYLRPMDREEYNRIKFTHKDAASGVNQQPEIYTEFGDKTLLIWKPARGVYAPATPTDDQKLHTIYWRDVKMLGPADEITELKPKHIPTLIWGGYAFGAMLDDEKDVDKAYAMYELGLGVMKRGLGELAYRPVQVARQGWPSDYRGYTY